VSGPTDYVLRLELPATHEAVRVARHMATHFSRMNGVPDEERDTLALVASELLANAVDHGGGGAALDESQLLNGVGMAMALTVSQRGWTLEVSDQGGGDPASFQPMLEEDGVPDLEDDRGRGLFLMRSSVERLVVERSDDGRGLKVTAVREYGGG
jgi:anti-sigma regulatory factor (Ser/Thr protein kinase)